MSEKQGSGIREQGSGEDTEVRSLGNGRYQVVTGTRRTTAYAISANRTTWVFLNGRTYAISQASGDRRRATGTNDEMALSAPMPATVVAVNAVAGQAVKRGDVLVTLEAMKMELAVRAPRDATVRKVLCGQGDLVQPGVPLVELE